MLDPKKLIRFIMIFPNVTSIYNWDISEKPTGNAQLPQSHTGSRFDLAQIGMNTFDLLVGTPNDTKWSCSGTVNADDSCRNRWGNNPEKWVQNLWMKQLCIIWVSLLYFVYLGIPGALFWTHKKMLEFMDNMGESKKRSEHFPWVKYLHGTTHKFSMVFLVQSIPWYFPNYP